MEMMTMMMELEKLPDPFSIPFQDLSEFPGIEFSGSSSSTTMDSSPPTTMFCHYQPPPSMITTPPSLPPSRKLQAPPNSVEVMREMIFRIAAMQPVQIDPESVKPPKRRNVKISKDPQSVAARHRRERISERIRILQRLVPGGTKMDTASMLDEAVHYMKFLKKQVQTLEEQAAGCTGTAGAINVGFPAAGPVGGFNYSPLMKACGQHAAPMVGSMELLR